ncbi:MAG: 4Fe-4S dicluster domain-containing protein [bacterium]
MPTDANSEEKSSPEKKERKGPRGRPIINNEHCKGCGFCIEFCPSNVLQLSGQFNQKGYHYPEIADLAACTGCDLCGLYCPDFAIYGVRISPKKEKKDSE